MKPVHTAGVLVALALVACKGDDPPPPAPAPSASAAPAADPFGPLVGDRRNTSLDQIPATIRPLLPKHGIYAGGGGSATTPWRAVVDLSAGTISTATSKTVGILPFMPLDPPTTRPITDAERALFTGLAEHAWREQMPVLTHPTGDYGEVLVAVDDAQAFYLDGFGPITPASAAALVRDLKAIAVPGAR
ncbi:MAG: hypothetical protein ABSE49_19845 [Polyangiaceae bacterium]|jgi:hypothetical protein